MILLDTCVLIWWTTEPEKLSGKAAKACSTIRLEGAALSAMSIWEIGIKIKKRKLDLKLSIEDYVSRLNNIRGLEIIPVNEAIWIYSLKLDWMHEDPVDRTIVATATLMNLPIVTCDSLISAFYPQIIW